MLESEKLDVLLVSGTFDYGTSVSGNYVMYSILKSIPGLKFKVLPVEDSKYQNVDIVDFISVNSLDELPEHRILLCSGNDLTQSQIEYIHQRYGSKYMVICMTNWIYSNTNNSYPELNATDYSGELIEDRLEFMRRIQAEIICPSTHSANVHMNSKLKEIPFHLIPLPYDEIDIDTSEFEKSKSKSILWGTTQPDCKRKGKHRLENILNILYNKCKDPNEVSLLYVGPKTNINTKFRVNNLGMIPTRKQLSLVYRNCNVFALTTLADAGPMMAIECLKNNTPIVAYPYSIAADVVTNGKNGYVVDTDEDFANKLYDILFNENYHMDLDYIQSFNSLDVVVQKYKEIFK